MGHRLRRALPRHVRLRVWDEPRARELWLARDRIGIKPLYWTHAPRPAHLRVRDQGAPRGSRAGARDRRGVPLPLPLVPHRRPAPQTLFEGIRKLRRRHLAARRRRRRRSPSSRYWDPWDETSTSTALSEAEIAERVLDELRTSVQLRKVSDVPVGVFLSGGIDSSTNAALFARGRVRGRSRRSRSATTTTTRATTNELVYARHDGRACRRRAPRAAPHASTTCSTSCRGWCGCRTSRSPIRSACPCTTCRSSRARTASSCARSARAPTSSSSATRRGRRSSTSSAATTCRCRAPQASRRRRRASGRAGATGREVEYLRRGGLGPADLLGRRRVVHRGAEAAPALAARSARASTGSPRGTRSSRSGERFEAKARGALAPQLDDVRRPQPPAARAAADARRQDVDGRRPRGPGPVPRSSLRRASRSRSPTT